MPISSEDLAKAGKTSLDYYLKNAPVDQIGVEVPLYNRLSAKRRHFKGAKQNITVQIRKGFDSNFKWAYGESEVEFNRRDTIEQAQFPWRRAEDGFRIPYDELFANGIDVKEGRSKEFSLTANERIQLTNLMEEQLDAFRSGFIEKLSLELHRDGSASDDAVVGLDALESPLIPWEKRCYFINTKHIELHDNGIDIVSPTRPHDTLTFFQMVTMRLALVLKRANAHAVLSIA